MAMGLRTYRRAVSNPFNDIGDHIHIHTYIQLFVRVRGAYGFADLGSVELIM